MNVIIPASFQTFFIYLFIRLFTSFPPPPPPFNVNSIRRCLSWPPGKNDTKFQKTVAGGPTSWIYTYPICLWLCCWCCRWSVFLCLSSFFLLYYFFNFSVLLVVFILLLLLLFWCCCVGLLVLLLLWNLSITSFSILAMLLGFDLNIIVKVNKKVPPPA